MCQVKSPVSVVAEATKPEMSGFRGERKVFKLSMKNSKFQITNYK